MNTSLTEPVVVGFLVTILVFFTSFLWGANGTYYQFDPQFSISKVIGALLSGIAFGAIWYIRGYHLFSN